MFALKIHQKSNAHKSIIKMCVCVCVKPDMSALVLYNVKVVRKSNLTNQTSVCDLTYSQNPHGTRIKVFSMLLQRLFEPGTVDDFSA